MKVIIWRMHHMMDRAGVRQVCVSTLVIFFLIVKLKGIKNESDNDEHASHDVCCV